MLFKVDPTPYQLTVNSLKAQLDRRPRAGPSSCASNCNPRSATPRRSARRIDLARKRVEQNQELASTGAGNRFDLEQSQTDLRDLEAQLGTAIANEAQVRAQLAAVVDGDIASIAKIKADLASAQWELQQTVVRSPCDCYVVNLQLRPGAFVAGMPFNPVMSLVESTGQVVALFHQNELHQIEPATRRSSRSRPIPGASSRRRWTRVIWAAGPGPDARRAARCR